MARPRGTSSTQSDDGITKSANKGRVRFIFEPDRHSPNGITYSWLIHKAYDGKEKAAIATRTFWLPFAYRDNGNASEMELRELAQQSIWRLEEQIQYLRESFGLDIALRGPTPAPSTESESSALPEEKVTSTVSPLLPVEDDLLGDFSAVL